MHFSRILRAAALLALPGLAQAVDFATEVHPILAARCAPCHSGTKPAAGLSLASRAAAIAGGAGGPAIVAGDSAASLLIQKISGQRGATMPASGEPLTAAQIATLRAWIDGGAVWPEITPQPAGRAAPGTEGIPPRQPDLPAGSEPHPVDRFIAAYFVKHGIAFPAQAPDTRFARRVYFDLWGLPPAPSQLEAFTHDRDPGKRARLIDTLLADSSPYAEHWISWWNDLLRNDPGSNYAGERKSITDWLLGALQQNLSYDRMIAALLNPVEKTDPDGFLIGVNWRGDINASQTPYMQAAQNTAQIFLGINLKCASCHDSFINRYKLRESYGMAALFAPQSRLELVRCDVKTGQYTGPQLLYPELGTVPEDAPLSTRHEAAARFFTDPRNGRVARTIVNRYWQKLFGHGLVEPVDEMDGEPWNADLLDWLASDFTAHGSDLKYLLRLLVTSKAYQLTAAPSAEQPEKPYVFRGPRVRRLSAEEFADTVSAVTGEWRLFEKDPEKEKAAIPARDWRFKASPLALALGRPIRDQVFTTRDDRPTTFQALELVNGASLENTLRRGALRLLGQLPAAPENLFDSGRLRKGAVSFDVDVSGLKKLWLLEEDAGSYDPARTVAGWVRVEFFGPQGVRDLADLAPAGFSQQALTAQKEPAGEALTMPPGSRIAIPIEGAGYVRVRGRVALDDRSTSDDIEGAVRFFIFGAEPDSERLVRVSSQPPAPALPPFTSVSLAGDQLYLQLFARKPNPAEARIVRNYFAGGKMSPAALEDLLWSLLLHPEFQYLY
jgi:mono/diheme cytochrome c family protein